MLELFEPAKAEKGKLTYGSDYVAIKYPEVNTCLTLTLVYPRMIVGSHFGLKTKGTAAAKGSDSKPFSPEDAKLTLDRMVALAAPDKEVQRALLIGCVDLWMSDGGKAYDEILAFCKKVDPGYRASQVDTTSYGSVDIEVYRDKRIITIKKTNGPLVNTITIKTK